MIERKIWQRKVANNKEQLLITIPNNIGFKAGDIVRVHKMSAECTK